MLWNKCLFLRGARDDPYRVYHDGQSLARRGHLTSSTVSAVPATPCVHGRQMHSVVLEYEYSLLILRAVVPRAAELPRARGFAHTWHAAITLSDHALHSRRPRLEVLLDGHGVRAVRWLRGRATRWAGQATLQLQYSREYPPEH